MHSFDLSVERLVSAGMTVSAIYMNSRGDKLPFFRDINFNPATSTVDYVIEGAPLGSFPFYRGTRPNTPTSVDDRDGVQRRDALQRARARASKRFADGLMFNAQLHAVEGRRQRPVVGDVLRREPSVRRAELPHQRPGQHDVPVEQRPASPLRRQLPLPARLPVGHRHQRHPDARERPADLRSASPATCKRRSGATFTTGTNGTGGSNSSRPGWGSTPIGRRAAIPSTSARRRTSGLAARKGIRCCGRSSTSSTPRTTRTFSDTAFDVIGDAGVRCGDQPARP